MQYIQMVDAVGTDGHDRDVEHDVEVAPGELGRLHLSPADEPAAVLVLGHGAGGGIESPDLAGLAAELPPRGVTVIRFEQPWKLAGRAVAGPARALDRAWTAALRDVSALLPGVPLFVGGRSTGARVACRCFDSPALGLVLSAFPLHPPGRPDKSRVGELARVAPDCLIFQTEGDPFGGAAELSAALAALGTSPALVVTLEGRTHGPDSRSVAGRERLPATVTTMAAAAARFILGRAGGAASRV